MRRSVANCSITLLIAISLGLAVISAQLVLPARVDSREVPYSFEDGGDPDAPDQVRVVTDKMEGLRSAPEVRTQYMADPSDVQTDFGSPFRVYSKGICLWWQWRDLVFRLWFSIASLVSAF